MKFECQESCGGKCCSFDWDAGKRTYIFLTQADRERIAAHTKWPMSAFVNFGLFESTRFSKTPTVQWYIKDDGNKCLFFKDGKCGIYPVRPTQCRTFPYWPENMTDEAEAELKKICPGVGVGLVITQGDKLKEQEEADRELRSQIV